MYAGELLEDAAVERREKYALLALQVIEVADLHVDREHEARGEVFKNYLYGLMSVSRS